MRRSWIDGTFLVLVWGAAYLAGLVRFTARLAFSRSYAVPWSYYLLQDLLWLVAVILLLLPLWLVLRRGGTVGNGFQTGLFLLYALPGLLMLTALPLYYTGVGQPLAGLFQYMITYGSETLGGAMVGIGLLRATIRE